MILEERNRADPSKESGYSAEFQMAERRFLGAGAGYGSWPYGFFS